MRSMMTRATTGRPLRSHLSEALSRQFLGSPPGWTFCGLIGLTVMVYPVARSIARALDAIVREPCHCDEAVLRSIERASWEAFKASSHFNADYKMLEVVL